MPYTSKGVTEGSLYQYWRLNVNFEDRTPDVIDRIQSLSENKAS